MALENLDVRVVGNTLTITIDLAETVGETKRGAPVVARSTARFHSINTPDGKLWLTQFMVGRSNGRDYE